MLEPEYCAGTSPGAAGILSRLSRNDRAGRPGLGRGASAPPAGRRHPAALPADRHACSWKRSSAWFAAAHYTGPLNLTWVGIGGGFDGPNPCNFMEFIRRAPDGACLTLESRSCATCCRSTPWRLRWACIARAASRTRIWGQHGERMTSVQQIEQLVRVCARTGSRDRERQGSARDLQDRRAVPGRRRDAGAAGHGAEPQAG